MSSTLGVSVLFNYKCKVAFGRLDSILECAKNFPMEKKELNVKINQRNLMTTALATLKTAAHLLGLVQLTSAPIATIAAAARLAGVTPIWL